MPRLTSLPMRKLRSCASVRMREVASPGQVSGQGQHSSIRSIYRLCSNLFLQHDAVLSQDLYRYGPVKLGSPRIPGVTLCVQHGYLLAKDLDGLFGRKVSAQQHAQSPSNDLAQLRQQGDPKPSPTMASDSLGSSISKLWLVRAVRIFASEMYTASSARLQFCRWHLAWTASFAGCGRFNITSKVSTEVLRMTTSASQHKSTDIN